MVSKKKRMRDFAEDEPCRNNELERELKVILHVEAAPDLLLCWGSQAYPNPQHLPCTSGAHMPHRVVRSASPEQEAQAGKVCPEDSVRFLNPFNRKHPPGVLLISTGFLFSPILWVSLRGHSLREVFEGEARYKSWIRLLKGSKPRNTTISKIRCSLDELSDRDDFSPGFLRMLEKAQAAFDGDAETHENCGQIGWWEVFFEFGIMEGLTEFPVLVERACFQAREFILARQFREAADFLANDSVMKYGLWDEALECLRNAHDAKEIGGACVAIAFEFHLAILASYASSLDIENLFWDVVPNKDHRHPKGKEDGIARVKNPTARFTDCLRKKFGTSTKDYLDPDAKWKRWSSGIHHPERENIQQLLKALDASDDQQVQVWCWYNLAIHLHFMGHTGQEYVERAERARKNGGNFEKFRPWPNWPFGHARFEDWVSERYTFWCAYHRKAASHD